MNEDRGKENKYDMERRPSRPEVPNDSHEESGWLIIGSCYNSVQCKNI